MPSATQQPSTSSPQQLRANDLIQFDDRRHGDEASRDCSRDSAAFLLSSSASMTFGDTSPLRPVSYWDSGSASVESSVSADWRYICHAAAIYLQQGENNEKFFTHPRDKRALPAYLLVHSQWFHLMDTCVAIILLLLALFEKPSVIAVPVWLHAVIELGCLLFVGLQLFAKVIWLGLRKFICHRRTCLKTVCFVIMIIEAAVILGRQETHFRITRALRPIFLLDSHYCYGVRRVIRQIFQSLAPVLDILVLLLYFMFVFSLMAYYLFHETDSQYFAKPWDSFVNLFILLTTANFPDVMMPAYAKSTWSAAFFIAYLSIELYFIMNLMLVAVYDAFATTEQRKFKKLYTHRREACKRAFRLLACYHCDVINNETNEFQDAISFDKFFDLMTYFKPSSNAQTRYLSFKALKRSERSQTLTLADFHRIYDVSSMTWTQLNKTEQIWFDRLPGGLRALGQKMRIFVRSTAFLGFYYFISFCSGIWFLLEASLNDSKLPIFALAVSDSVYFMVNLIFISLFAVEILLKLCGLGPKEYFSSFWNILPINLRITSLITVGAFVGLWFNFSFILLLRCLDLLRLFALKERYRDILNMMTILLPRLISSAILFLLLYYCFAIIGIEIFGDFDLRNCCKNSFVEVNYKFDPNGTITGDAYYLNNFGDIVRSGVTLFELTVVNNWHITMEAYAQVAGEWTRIYFMIFFIVTMVVLTIVVAFILEAFLFRIQCRRKGLAKEDNVHCELVNMTTAELALAIRDGKAAAQAALVPLTTVTPVVTNPNVILTFEGSRLKNRFDFYQELYNSEIAD